MILTNWNPWRELDALRHEVERAFEQYGVGTVARPLSRANLFTGRSQVYPLINVGEDKDNVYVEALAPGVDPETLEITVLRDTLRIAGEKQAISADVKPEAYHRNERGAGKFVRSLKLPVDVNGDAVKAEYKNGVLLITLPKAEAAKPKQIEVKVS